VKSQKRKKCFIKSINIIPPIVRNRLMEMSGSPKKGFIGRTNIHGNLKK
jgi:hypothetical protein